jgi:hypothetical protein
LNASTTIGFVVLLVPIVLFASSSASSANGKMDAEAQKGYASPKAVFDAYREARAKREARAVFSVLTPQTQSAAVFEAIFSCMERQGTDAIRGRRSEAKEIGLIVEKYFDYPAAVDDYQKQYKKKHGIDLAKFRAKAEAETEKNPNAVIAEPPRDDQLWYDAVTAHVKDKAGFYVAVKKHFQERDAKHHINDPVWPLGDLEQLVVQGDTATGRAKETILPRADESPLKPGQKPPIYERPFKFRRINGGWLIDSP